MIFQIENRELTIEWKMHLSRNAGSTQSLLGIEIQFNRSND